MTTHDVFISYAHVDNEALLSGQEGWVSVFQRALEKRLSQLIGRAAAVWWDKRRLTGNAYFDETIALACESSTTMVSVVTPRYLKSDYCLKEVEHFCTHRAIKVGDRSRLFTCVKTPVAREDLCPQFAGKLGYEFYKGIAEGDHFREYDVYDPDLKILFMDKLEELAQDIAKLVDERPSSHPPGDKRSAPAARLRPSVFVATTAGDVKTVRESIVRELEAHGLRVLPEQSAPWSENAGCFLAELSDAVGSASLSVHILGGSYGAIPDNGAGSYPALQLEQLKQIAAGRPKQSPLVRIVWIARTLEVTNAKQADLLAAVRSDPTVGPHDELLEGSIEELKERILCKARELEQRMEAASLTPSPSTPPVLLSSSPGVRKVYVIAAKTEEENRVFTVARALGAHGFDVISSLELTEEETEAAREMSHQRWLEQCEGCLILHGNSKVSWVRAQIDEVRKAVGQRATGPMFGQVVYLAPPIEALKRNYQVYFPKLEWIQTPAEDLVPFVRDLQQEVPSPTLRPAAALPGR